ncbi:hypothetical protein LEP1GSC047_2928 [Leptospira inadai serovar Lyme str. 10]|uniref:Uncharacterized protein n=2 Tax=Leptospira inadai serovar Lyme TaxID=293084 RepID=V6HAC6_9LEPT|nr:hypothetical protein [Leptospira inadai]EQA36321.1 hypothetical protein LEP1GSC047_2928 [Leptospira inadai serovar Lyme str. 10]PNV75585.1 hypothetical protein BES34_008110 [Leptospira inadai serovar Lyme]
MISTNVISYSFAGSWLSVYSQIPVLESKFYKNLFNDPERTQAVTTDEGLKIFQNTGILPFPEVLLNSVGIRVTGYTSLSVSNTFEKIKSEFNYVTHGGFGLGFSNVALYSEHEFNDLEIDGGIWLAEKFIIKNVKTNDKIKISEAKIIDFELIVDGNRKFHFQLQPRFGKKNSIFIAVLQDLPWNQIPVQLPDAKTVQELLDSSVLVLQEDILEIILK